MPKVSIIVPVYNAEKYLRETLNSVADQTYSDFELIAVNDGSKDSSLSILREYEEKDARIRVIDKLNSGVSDTRNIGISQAKGEYVAFLDADDLYSPEYLSVMMNVAEEKNADIVVCEYETFRNVAIEIYKRERSNKAQLTDIQKLLDSGLMTSMQIKLFRKELLQKNNVQLDKSLTFGEDLFFCWKVCLVGKNIYQIDQKLYGYRLSGEGATSKYHDGLYEKYQAAFSDLKEFCSVNDLDTKMNLQQIDLYFAKRLPSLSMMCARSKMNTRAKKAYIAKILRDENIQSVLSTNFEKLVEGAPKGTYRLYKDARNRDVNGVLRFGKRLNIRIFLSKWKNKLRGKLCDKK